MKHYVLYVEDCEPKVKAFISKSSLKRFLTMFVEKHGWDDGDSNCIDLVFKSDEVTAYGHYTKFLDKPKAKSNSVD